MWWIHPDTPAKSLYLNKPLLNKYKNSGLIRKVCLVRYPKITPTYLFFYVALCICSSPVVLFGQSATKKASQVWTVDIRGNKTFSDIHIKNQIATEGYTFLEKLKFWRRSRHQMNDIEIRKDVIRIRDFYNQHGFPNAKVHYRIESKSKKWKKKVVFFIDEGSPIRIKNISFNVSGKPHYQKVIMNSPKFMRVRRQSKYQVGRRYATILKSQVKGQYTQVLKNLGFAYANVTLSAAVDTAKLSANLTVNIDPGPRTYINNISVEGAKTVSDHYVIRESGLHKGEQFSLKALRNAQQQIFNHPLFQFVTINIPEQPKDSTINLRMQVRESPLRTVRASVGFGTEDYLRGQLSWTDRNALGHAHKFTISGKASFTQQSLNLNYLFPYAFNRKSSFVISPLAEHLLEPSYELYSVGITNSFIYQYSRHITGSVSYQFTRNNENSPLSNAQLPDTTQSYNLSSLQFSGFYNQAAGRRSPIGWSVQPYAEISGIFGSATYQFEKLSLEVRRFTHLTKTTTLATRLQGGRIFASHVDSLPHNIRFYVGGTNSVRGWYRDELGPKRVVTNSVKDSTGNVLPDTSAFKKYVPEGGRTFFAFNFEIRQAIDALVRGFGLAAFLDGGQVWKNSVNLNARPVQFAAGGGIRYSSPIGPVRLYVGYKLNPTDKDLNRYRGHNYGNAWNRIAIHISVGRAF